jgi:O-antigen/teichoic acid export membrane protein
VSAARAEELGVAPGGLRGLAARGTMVNALFSTGLAGLGLVRTLVVAALVSTEDYGVWGIIIVAFGTLGWLRQVGVSDRYVQQEDLDQELAFQRAFTMEAIVSAAYAALLLAAVPLVVLVFDEPRVAGPALALCLVVPATVLQTPIWVWYRRMRFVRQRLLLAVDAVVGLLVTIAAAAAGLGVWAFVAGALAGAWSGALVAVLTSPYPLRLRIDRATVRSYLGFSWPLFAAGLAGVVTAQLAVFTADQRLGLAAVGAIALAGGLAEFTHRVDGVVTQALYPAICAVADRLDVLREAFLKSNRLTLMWGMPFGAGLALFAQPLVDHVLGEKWQQAVVLLQALGVGSALNHVAFNWDAFLRARGDTRPVAVWAVASFAAFLVVPLPLLAFEGLPAYAWGLVVFAVVSLALRAWLLAGLFRPGDVLGLLVRGAAPVLPGAALVLALDAPVLAELALFVLPAAALTALLERALLREALGYLR